MKQNKKGKEKQKKRKWLKTSTDALNPERQRCLGCAAVCGWVYF